jgi:hypothetical protein
MIREISLMPQEVGGAGFPHPGHVTARALAPLLYHLLSPRTTDDPIKGEKAQENF